ncbi:MAG TPA: hypothetical protein VHQ01_06060, partial [Pyrinomonadaceae bacterium]|nr:hypothetical protein [Pyrinomonadaceae bacterium]
TTRAELTLEINSLARRLNRSSQANASVATYTETNFNFLAERMNVFSANARTHLASLLTRRATLF